MHCMGSTVGLPADGQELYFDCEMNAKKVISSVSSAVAINKQAFCNFQITLQYK